MAPAARPRTRRRIDRLALNVSGERLDVPRAGESRDVLALAGASCRACGSEGLELRVLAHRSTGVRRRLAECDACEATEPI